MATYDYLTKGNDDGTIIGGSTEKLIFFGSTGKTPVARSSMTNSTLTCSLSSSSGAWGVSTSSQMSSLIGQVQELAALMYYYGLCG